MKLKVVLFLASILLSGGLLAQSSVYSDRRAKVFETIGKDVAILKNTGRDYVLPIDINWNFYFLTGVESEGSILVLNGKENSSIIYRPGRPYGPQLPGIEGIETKALEDFEKDLPRLISRAKTLWLDFSSMLNFDNPALRLTNLQSIKNIAPAIHDMRKIKDAHEMELLTHAIETTAAGLVEVMKASEPGMNEKDYELILKYKFQQAGCEHLGFNIQAASGPNSTLVHYGDNDRQTEKGEMMVFDVGARAGYYSADISRSFPVTGKFTKEQKEIYSIVLKAQKTAITNMKPGVNITVASNIAAEELNKGLYELGLITDLDKTWQKRFWIQHGFFHHIGLVVHDVGGYGGILEPGMILTMEPGLYFPEGYLETASKRFGRSVDQAEIDAFIKAVKPNFEKYINIGVRIEDDVYITESGNRVISKDVPKEIDEIEELMKEGSFFNKQ